MPGYLQPGVLFVGPTKQQERQFLYSVFQKLRGKYERYVEPSVGSFVMAQVARAAGYAPSSMEFSDVTLFSSVLGYLCSGRDLAELDVKVEGTTLGLSGVPIEDAAMILYMQARIRFEQKSEHDYWHEYLRDMSTGAERHIATLTYQLKRLTERFRGCWYEPMDIMDHIERAKDGHCVIYAAPPSYGGGYEKFYDTQGRLTWREPKYGMFDPDEGVGNLLGMTAQSNALLLILEERLTGEASSSPIYARQMAPGRSTYVISNRPEEVLDLTGIQAIDRGGWKAEPLQVPIIPYDHEITTKSKVEVKPIPGVNALYYRDLWMHKIDYKPAHNEFAVFVDNYLAGIAGYDTRSVNMTFAEKWSDALILTYAVGAPHALRRLTRLVTMLALSKEVVRAVVPPWAAVQAKRVMTTAFTKYPESKGLRGIMKLDERQKDNQYGYRLIYVKELEPMSPKGVFNKWMTKEEQWRKSQEATATS